MMNSNVEHRARALCAIDAQMAAVPSDEIPALVERLWPVAALEMSGGAVESDTPQPADLAERMSEYQRLKR
ncbi:hypothetical protein FHS55_002413 [Angulomicrobium tetraedrale]|uniref:Uncharacterized protein n=1 Tax=Ancylobacter tetraedralis TaxID=217068 RepID=A0A839ZAP7_9HYPH|nr:hypothetical protein [Ancylobacter tetraedralis]MBB3771804.1 hypothetical protein [Ancylobacter tetraedralis]